MIKVNHTCKLLKRLELRWSGKLLNCFHFGSQRSGSPSVDGVTEKINLAAANLTLVNVNYKSESSQLLKKEAEVS